MSDPRDKKPELGRYLKETGYALRYKLPRLDKPTPGVEFFDLSSEKVKTVVLYSPRGLPLIWGHGHPTEGAVLTMECYCKWYELFLVWPDKITTVFFGALEPHRGDESAYRDHVPNPRAVIRLAKANGYLLDREALEMIIGRWELECLDRYDDVMEDLA